MLHLGVAGVYAQQRPVNMTFSGTAGASTINDKQPGTNNSEDNSAGKGALGPFTFRNVRAIRAFPEPSSTCSGPKNQKRVYFSSVAGAGVFRFEDGSLLKVNLTQAGDCIDFAANQEAHCTMTFQIAGGTGRFKDASGTLTLTENGAAGIGRCFWQPRLFCRYREGYGNGFRSGYGGRAARRAAIGRGRCACSARVLGDCPGKGALPAIRNSRPINGVALSIAPWLDRINDETSDRLRLRRERLASCMTCRRWDIHLGVEAPYRTLAQVASNLVS